MNKELLPFNLKVAQTHIRCLEEIEILKKPESKKLQKRLKELSKKSKKLDLSGKNLTIFIYNFLQKKFKNLGEKFLTGTTSEDQNQTALRLFMKTSLAEIRVSLIKIVKDYVRVAEENKTYSEPLKTTVSHWILSTTESLIDDIYFLDHTYNCLNKNPLGQVDGYGSKILLPREFATEELNFKEIQINSLYCKNSSNKYESLYLETLKQIIISFDNFISDISNFSKNELIKEQKALFKSIIKTERNSKKTIIEATNKVKIFLENTEELNKKIFKKAPTKIQKKSTKKLHPQIIQKISLGAPGNLDLNYYKTILGLKKQRPKAEKRQKL